MKNKESFTSARILSTTPDEELIHTCMCCPLEANGSFVTFAASYYTVGAFYHNSTLQ